MEDVSGSILLDLRESLVIRYKDIALVGFVRYDVRLLFDWGGV